MQQRETKQAVAVTISERNKTNRPTKIAPIMLVAAKVTANRITEVSAVPNIPVKTAVNAPLTQRQEVFALQQPVVANNTAKYPMAMPNATQRKAGVTVITAVICKKAAITPIIALAITERVTQLTLFSQQKIPIFFTPSLHFMREKEYG